MTAGSNGASTPENDDPFAYLYRSEGGEDGAGGAAGDGANAPNGHRPGVPRTSYNQVTRVGERQYGQQLPPQPGYGQQASPHYAAPETLPGGAPRQSPPAGHSGHGGGRGPNSKGLLIGAIAVVAVVVIGIGAAMVSNSTGEKGAAGGTASASTGGSGEVQPDDPAKDKPADKPFSSKKEDAISLKLAGGAITASDVPDATSSSGSYVAGMNTPGASATWTLDVPKSGAYTLFVGYGVPGHDANASLLINGKPRTDPLNMGNFAGAQEGDWAKGWTRTYAFINLNEGTNTIQLSCAQGNTCDFNLDWVKLKSGQVTNP